LDTNQYRFTKLSQQILGCYLLSPGNSEAEARARAARTAAQRQRQNPGAATTVPIATTTEAIETGVIGTAIDFADAVATIPSIGTGYAGRGREWVGR
jgi:hypothetical protein